MGMMKTWRFYIIFVLLGLSALYVYTRSEVAVPVNQPLNLFPEKVAEWAMTGQARFDERTLAVLRPTDYLSRSYVDEHGNSLSLYIGFHGGGPESGPIHSPKHCLPGSGWNRLNEEVKHVKLGDGEMIPYVSAVYQKDSEKQLFLYWFQVRNDILTNEYSLKLARLKNSLLSNRRDSAFIRLSVMATDGVEPARAIGERFIHDFFPAIKSALPK